MRNHPLNAAEAKLFELGIKHAPIQGFLECGGVDARFVTLQEQPGVYYILGIDNAGAVSTAEKIQLIFMAVPVNAQEIADALGWKLEKVEDLPINRDVVTIPPLPVYDGLTTTPSAFLVMK